MTLPSIVAVGSSVAIASIWLGYPVLVWLIAAVRRSSCQGDVAGGATRSVSVILATRDSAEIIRARVANLLETDHPLSRLEVVVVLDAAGALSNATDLHGLGDRVRVIVGDAPGGKASGLNAGVRVAAGEVLVLADAQQRFDVRTIPELVGALEDPRFGAVSGALELGRASRTPSPVDVYWALEKWLRFNEARIHSTVGVTGAVYATRRALWPIVPAGTLLDDVYVPMALVLAGHRVGFTYAARAFDVRAFNADHESVRKTRTLTGVIQLLKLLPDILSPRRNPIMLQFVLHKLTRLLTPFFSALFALAVLVLIVQFTVHATPTERTILAVIAVVFFMLPPARRRTLALAQWGLAMQVAAARAVFNGVSGRWSVWNKPRA